MKGRCVNNDNTLVLLLDKSYHLFPNGEEHVYVSNFNSISSHMGCFQASRFIPIQEETWPTEPEAIVPNLERTKLYKAELIWRLQGYKQTALGTYFVRPSKTNGYFYTDESATVLKGCFPLHWFTDYKEVGPIPRKEKPKPEPQADEQLSFF